MKQQISCALILILPLLISFSYVVAAHMFQNTSSFTTPQYSDFLYIIISSGIAQIFWFVNMILMCQGAMKDVGLWKVVMMMVMLQVILVYGLAVYFTFVLVQSLYNRAHGASTMNNQYYVTWSAVCVGCLWFVFFILLAILIAYIFQKKRFTKLPDQQTKVYNQQHSREMAH